MQHIKGKAPNAGISIVLCGEAGQGIQTIEHLITGVMKRAGYHVFATKEYMSRIRGGSNSTEIRVSSAPVAAFVNQIDILVPLDQAAIPHLAERITDGTFILGEHARITSEHPLIDIPFTKLATEIGNPILANTIASGLLAGLFHVETALLTGFIKDYFATKDDAIIKLNIEAAQRGNLLGTELRDSGRIGLVFPPAQAERRNEIILDGAKAVALGAIAGGCNFIASYPMSPGTGVLTNLAEYGAQFSIIVEQAEDEIAAINMALGAWYAGARAIVTTSGGGFALMAEGMSLAGMIESPLVIHLAQRPGPATGLPTRTEQGDLELALHAGHGDFPRIILTPGNLTELFQLTRQAFDLADRFQVPVLILTDQYLMDSFYNVPAFDLENLTVTHYFKKTNADYQRYALTDDGISPRGIPGFGAGLVAVDSDEHDTSGHIIEDAATRTIMVRKRLRKAETLITEAVAPELTGASDYNTLVVGWGSTYHPIQEALASPNRPGWAFLHFKQVYPLPPHTLALLQKARRVIAVENNATGQFARLIKSETGMEIQARVLKYDGRPFAVEELAEHFDKLAETGE